MFGTAIDLWERLQCAGSPGTSRTEYRAGNTDRKRDRPADTGKRGNQCSGCGIFPDEMGEIQDSTYTLLPEYDNTKIDLNTLTTAEQLEEAAKTLAETAKQEQGKKTDGNGQVVFEKQELGVYLLTAKDQPGYDLVSPTLLSIPTMETDETLHYDIKVEPKHTPRPAEHTAPQPDCLYATCWYLAGGVLLLVLAGGLDLQQNDMRRSKGLLGLVFLLVLLGVGCFYLAYREQKPFQEMKVKGEALQKLVVQETGSQEANPMERTIDFSSTAAHQSGDRRMVVCAPDRGRQPHFNRTDGYRIPDQRF